MTSLSQTIRAWSRASDHVVASMREANRATFAALGVPATPTNDRDGGNGTAIAGTSDDQSIGDGSSVSTIGHEEWETSRTVDDPSAIAVGDTVTFAKTIDESDVADFAFASGDTNRLHLDDSFAGQTRFGGRIAHGTLVSGLISAALARIPGVTVYLSQDLEFRGPVAVGDELTATVEVLEDLGGDRYRLETIVETASEPVVTGEAVVLVDPLPDSAV
ncbi:MaoC family dehydratase [Halosolutus amylolyticus]|uniref:MaoC family dehydratase n=1 Tax=Halosolutus amylolyticus TaxID=2932267 RepID=A0ABD5PNC8_9EURY|nr:MaoC family dehydratase [Halosolutus amylolyticus]